MITVQELKTRQRWNAQGATALDSADNYMGDDHSDWIVGPGRTRDSDVLAESNFAVALEMLGGVSATVKVESCGHWACGWFEQILVHESDDKALAILADIATVLQDCPVLDDSDYSNREYESASATIDSENGFLSAVCEALGADEDELSESEAAELKALGAAMFRNDVAYGGLRDAWVQPGLAEWCKIGDCACELYDLRDKSALSALVYFAVGDRS
jgi:hypothetical protein